MILPGGPKAVYEPWDFFGLSPDDREGADVVVTGEEYVLLELLDRMVEEITGVAELCGMSRFFGTDDNFFSRRETVEETLVAMARSKVGGRPIEQYILGRKRLG